MKKEEKLLSGLFYTKDPTIFSYFAENRQAKTKGILKTKLSQSIIEGGILNPLIVTPDLRILDGQRRNIIAAELKKDHPEKYKDLEIPYLISHVPEEKYGKMMISLNN